jgi:hypothetical protein
MAKRTNVYPIASGSDRRPWRTWGCLRVRPYCEPSGETCNPTAPPAAESEFAYPRDFGCAEWPGAAANHPRLVPPEVGCPPHVECAQPRQYPPLMASPAGATRIDAPVSLETHDSCEIGRWLTAHRTSRPSDPLPPRWHRAVALATAIRWQDKTEIEP